MSYLNREGQGANYQVLEALERSKMFVGLDESDKVEPIHIFFALIKGNSDLVQKVLRERGLKPNELFLKIALDNGGKPERVLHHSPPYSFFSDHLISVADDYRFRAGRKVITTQDLIHAFVDSDLNKPENYSMAHLGITHELIRNATNPYWKPSPN